MSASGRQRPLASLSRERPLSGVKRTSRTLGLRDSDFRFRPKPVIQIIAILIDFLLAILPCTCFEVGQLVVALPQRSSPNQPLAPGCAYPQHYPSLIIFAYFA